VRSWPGEHIQDLKIGFVPILKSHI